MELRLDCLIALSNVPVRVVLVLELPPVETGVFCWVEETPVDQGSLRPRQSSWTHNSRASFPSTQKKRKMKKPCREVKMVKRYWNVSEASDMVSAPNTHDIPKRNMIPKVLMNNRLTPSTTCFSLLPYFFIECITSTLITSTKMTELKIIMAKIGTRKAPKKTPTSPMKQLRKRMVLLNHTPTLNDV